MDAPIVPFFFLSSSLSPHCLNPSCAQAALPAFPKLPPTCSALLHLFYFTTFSPTQPCIARTVLCPLTPFSPSLCCSQGPLSSCFPPLQPSYFVFPLSPPGSGTSLRALSIPSSHPISAALPTATALCLPSVLLLRSPISSKCPEAVTPLLWCPLCSHGLWQLWDRFLCSTIPASPPLCCRGTAAASPGSPWQHHAAAGVTSCHHR